MVKLNKIYTRTGDDGTTGLANGARVRKDDLRVECYGTVDEANSAIGLAVLAALQDHPQPGPRIAARIAEVLRAIQHDLFDAGADLATPTKPDEAPGSCLRIIPVQTERLEHLIDEFNDPLEALTSFVLPGGTPLAASLHLARTIVRRAERLGVSLLAHEPETTSPESIKYLNRLSDLLFVLGRIANDRGKLDILWKPGSSRGG